MPTEQQTGIMNSWNREKSHLMRISITPSLFTGPEKIIFLMPDTCYGSRTSRSAIMIWTVVTLPSCWMHWIWNPTKILSFPRWSLWRTIRRFWPSMISGINMNSTILYKGHENISIKSFEMDRIKESGIVDRFDLITELIDRYGCKISDYLNVMMPGSKGRFWFWNVSMRKNGARCSLQYQPKQAEIRPNFVYHAQPPVAQCPFDPGIM